MFSNAFSNWWLVFSGAFAVAYIASLLFCCLPLIMMELAVGQLSARAPPQALHAACPLFKGKKKRRRRSICFCHLHKGSNFLSFLYFVGVGVALVLYTIIFMSTFVVQISYLLNFLTQLFLRVYNDPPWLSCGQTWNSDYEQVVQEPSDFEDRTHHVSTLARCLPLRNYTPSEASPRLDTSLEEFYE